MKRQKIMERDNFSYEEKQDIAKKSDNKCCHCGKKVYTNFGATVEHFIPISKGGTNRDINLVMLCEECNKKKSNFIYYPKDYLPYLHEEELKKLEGYFDSYIKSFDFVNRDNLLACDRYKIWVEPLNINLQKSIRNRKSYHKYEKFMYEHSQRFWLKRATSDDIDKLTEYFIRYLKKYDCLDSEKAARINIEFWITFGCIYYIEDKNENIKVFVTVTVTQCNNRIVISDDDINNFLTMNVFSYYSTDLAITLAYNLSRHIPSYITNEQELVQIPVKYCMLKNDPLSMDICNRNAIYNVEKFVEAFTILHDRPVPELPKIEKDEKLKEFFNRFAQLNEERLKLWFKIHNSETLDWMIRELMLPEEGDINDQNK